MYPGDQQKHPGYGAGEEAEGENHHDGGHQKDCSPQLGLIPNCLHPEPVDDVDCAVDKDDEGDDNLGKEDHLSHTVNHVLKSEKRINLIIIHCTSTTNSCSRLVVHSVPAKCISGHYRSTVEPLF